MIAKIQLKDFSNYEEYSYIPEDGMWLKSSSEKVVSSEQALLEVCRFIISSRQSEDSLPAIEVYFQDGQKREIELARNERFHNEETETENLRELYLLLADSVQNLNCWSMHYNIDRQFLSEAARIYPWLDPDSICNTLSEAGAEDWENADHYRSAIPKAQKAASVLRQAIERELYNTLIWEEDRASRIRRRIEDALRKGRPSVQIARRILVKAALELEVRLD
jgi:type II secretory ATPase GspE/PulE/Tfp pilus assembly ATPase PilB-like protein